MKSGAIAGGRNKQFNLASEIRVHVALLHRLA